MEMGKQRTEDLARHESELCGLEEWGDLTLGISGREVTGSEG